VSRQRFVERYQRVQLMKKLADSILSVAKNEMSQR